MNQTLRDWLTESWHPWAVAAIGCMALLKLVLMPLIDWQNSTFAENRQKQFEVTMLERKLANEQALLAQIEDLTEANRQITEGLLPAGESDQVKVEAMRRLEALFAAHQIKIQRRNWGQLTIQEGLMKIPLEIVAKGSANDLANCLVAIENETALMAIRNFSVSRQLRSDQLILQLGLIMLADSAQESAVSEQATVESEAANA